MHVEINQYARNFNFVAQKLVMQMTDGKKYISYALKYCQVRKCDTCLKLVSNVTSLIASCMNLMLINGM